MTAGHDSGEPGEGPQPPGGPQPGGWLFLRALEQAAPGMPAQPSPTAMAEAVALLAGRCYGAAFGLSGEVEAVDLIRALVNVCCALLAEIPEAAEFLQALGGKAAREALGEPGQAPPS